MQAPSARPVSARLRAEPPATREALSAEAHRLEAALDRFRAWRNQRAQEEAALIAQLTAHRKLTASRPPSTASAPGATNAPKRKPPSSPSSPPTASSPHKASPRPTS